MHYRLTRSLYVVTWVALVLLLYTSFAKPDPATVPASTADTASCNSTTVTMLGGAPDQVKLTPEEQQFVDLTNADRKANKLPPLTVAPLLVAVARDKSKEMYDLKYWGHVSPIKEKRTAMARVLYFLPKPPKTMTVGENLCYSEKVMVEEGNTALMKSPTHRANILNSAYQYLGIGTFTAPDGRFWTTEIFLTIDYGK